MIGRSRPIFSVAGNCLGQRNKLLPCSRIGGQIPDIRAGIIRKAKKKLDKNPPFTKIETTDPT